MTTFAADHDTSRALQELDERTREAWEGYRVSLNELAGAEYEAAEVVSWERLQQALQELADERERVVAGVSGEG
jgi:hypothetical protein